MLYFTYYAIHAAVLLKFTCYTQYCVQEQELWSHNYAIYIKACINNSLHVKDNFSKTVLLECICEWYKSILV